MKTPIFSKAFERDKDRCIRRGWNMEKFKTIARLLLSEQPLPPNANPIRCPAIIPATRIAMSRTTGF